MQDDLLILAPVALIQSKHNLGENAPNEVFSNILSTITLATFLDELGKIAAFAKLHYQID